MGLFHSIINTFYINRDIIVISVIFTIQKALRNQEFCSISKPERLRNRENAEIEQKNGFA